MKCMIVLAVLVAAVAAGEVQKTLLASPYAGLGAYGYGLNLPYAGLTGYPGYPYGGVRAVSSAPWTYAAAAPVPLTYAAPAPIAYHQLPYAQQVPVAYSVQSAPKVENTYEPVEHHGYRIAY